MDNGLTHFDAAGQAVMVDVSDKEETRRVAVAGGCIKMNREAFTAVAEGTAEKGDVLGTARIAGIMATKRTASLIPLCHPLLTEKVSLDFELSPESCTVQVRCTVQTYGKTGVEMEALCGASVALLTVYDMCKAVDRAMIITDVMLLEKSGGKSGVFRRDGDKNEG